MAPTVRVRTGARLHFGFGNLSLAHERLYGGVGVALEAPETAVRASPADAVACEHDRAREYAERACDLLDLPGADVAVQEALPPHVGLGSGTALALATLAAVARAHDRAPAVRERAPALGRGGRSGVGVAAFEDGGVVLDAGHPTSRFTTAPPETGEWTVPAVAARHDVPGDWRFLLVRPAVGEGQSDTAEDESMRAVVRGADPALADRVAGAICRRLLPAVAEPDLASFGDAVAAVGRLNGAWYADEQGGVYRPPVGELVTALAESPAVEGAGQSSWGPTVYGVTDADRAAEAMAAGRDALDAAGVAGRVRVVEPANRGARVERVPDPPG
ncbi:MAG: beta-ribofuranosylaminobenzene 5'-phosphate synthase family protein [Halobacteriaceae archaeon]